MSSGGKKLSHSGSATQPGAVRSTPDTEEDDVLSPPPPIRMKTSSGRIDPLDEETPSMNFQMSRGFSDEAGSSKPEAAKANGKGGVSGYVIRNSIRRKSSRESSSKSIGSVPAPPSRLQRGDNRGLNTSTPGAHHTAGIEVNDNSNEDELRDSFQNMNEMQSSDFSVVVATAVDSESDRASIRRQLMEEAVHARVLQEPEAQRKGQRPNTLLIIATLFLILIGLGLGLGLGLTGSSGDSGEPDETNLASGDGISAVPTPSPTQQAIEDCKTVSLQLDSIDENEYIELRNTIGEFVPGVNEDLDVCSDESITIWWLSLDPTYALKSDMEIPLRDLALQRYFLAVTILKLGGPPTSNSTDWFEAGIDVCAWENLSCDENGSMEVLYSTDGTLGGTIPTELFHLTTLTSLDLSENLLSGTIPTAVGSLRGLREVSFGRSLVMEGSIPSEFGLCTNLTSLDLGSTGVVGPIPEELYDIVVLEYIDLDFNELTNAISTRLGNLVSLKQLWARENALTGQIPSEVGLLQKLTTFDLMDNELGGSLPTEIGELTQLTEMLLSLNIDLAGTIPTEIGSMLRLESVQIFSASISGEIPSEIGLMSSLIYFDLDDNLLTGTVPAEIGSLEFLDELYMAWNKLSGVLPSEFGVLPNLHLLHLQHNGISGQLPDELGDIKNMDELLLQQNNLMSAIPSTIGSLSRLVILDLSNNTISGSIPTELGKCVRLKKLILTDTDLTGVIPSVVCNLPQIDELRVDCGSLDCSTCDENIFAGN